MPIEFRCTECGRRLRVPDGTAGKQANCPACGATMNIPPPEVSSPALPPPLAPEVPDAAAGGPGPNPYQSPQPYSVSPPLPAGYPSRPAAGPDYAYSRVAGPAIWLIVTGAVGVPVKLLSLFGALVILGGFEAGWGGPPGDPFMLFSGGLALVLDSIGLILCFVVILGAVKMKNLEHYGLAMTAAIVAMIPRVSPCCLLGLPFGIWAVVVLCEGPVKAAFKK